MIINDFKANKYPFTPNSTLELMPGLTLAPERVISAILYPVVTSPDNIRIKRLEKKIDNISLVLYSGNSKVCDILFPLDSGNSGNSGNSENDPIFNAGYAVQDDVLCGCLSVDKVFIDLLKSLPNLEFSDDAFVFSPGVCKLPVSENKKPGNIMYNGTPIKNISFVTEEEEEEKESIELEKDKIKFAINEAGEVVVDVGKLVDSVKTNPIKKIYINSKDKDSYIDTQKHGNITILPVVGTGLRVLTQKYGLTIGRFSEL